MIRRAFHWFISDKYGNIAIWQMPNLPIVGWLVFMLASQLLSAGHLRSGVALIGSAFLFTWAYLEVTQGASPFRRILGAVVLIAVVIGFFR